MYDLEAKYRAQGEDLLVPPETLAANDVLAFYHELLEYCKMCMRDGVTPAAREFRQGKLSTGLDKMDEVVAVLRKMLEDQRD